MPWTTVGGLIIGVLFVLLGVWVHSGEPLLDEDSRIRAWFQHHAERIGGRFHGRDDDA